MEAASGAALAALGARSRWRRRRANSLRRRARARWRPPHPLARAARRCARSRRASAARWRRAYIARCRRAAVARWRPRHQLAGAAEQHLAGAEHPHSLAPAEAELARAQPGALAGPSDIHSELPGATDLPSFGRREALEAAGDRHLALVLPRASTRRSARAPRPRMTTCQVRRRRARGRSRSAPRSHRCREPPPPTRGPRSGR